VKWLDRNLQDQRIRRVVRFVPAGGALLDVGCFDGRLLDRVADRTTLRVGVDPLASPASSNGCQIIASGFLDLSGFDGTFDVVTMLAVLEHVPLDDLRAWAQATLRVLRPGGVLAATIPSPLTDRVLDVLIRLRVLDGMEFDQHHGVEPESVVSTFRDAGFDVVERKRFQLGLNNLVVLRAPAPG
jgi:2-polyprenyl-3-methyl-5-hydroxy-6-metoxy-1,4-benzoquinol methylase